MADIEDELAGFGPYIDMDLLLSVSNGLGAMHQDEQGNQVYVAEDDCLDCLRDIQRFLRKDDPDTRQVFFQLSNWDTARNDLIPIVVHYAHDHQLVTNALKVLTFLTMPINPTSDMPAMQLTSMSKVKEAVVSCPEVLPVLLGEAAEALARHPRMSEDQVMTVQVCLTLLRNLLAIPDLKVLPGSVVAATDSAAGHLSSHHHHPLGPDVGLHARFLYALAESEGLELLTAVAQHTSERPFKSEVNLLLDLVHEVVRGIDPDQIMTAREPKPLTMAYASKAAAVPKEGTGNNKASGNMNNAAGNAHRSASGSSRDGGNTHSSSSGRVKQQQQQQQQQQKQKRGSQPQANARDRHAAATMQSILAAEKSKRAVLLRQAPRLHGRDTGRYVRQHDTTQTITANELQEGKKADAAKQQTYLKHGAKVSELPEMKVPAPTKGFKDGWLGGMEGGSSTPLPPSLAVKLRTWLLDFAKSGSYNELMEVSRRDAESGLGISRLDASDLCRFFRIARTFSTLTRLQQQQITKQKQRDAERKAKDQQAAATNKPNDDTTAQRGTDQANIDDKQGDADAVESVFAGVSSTMGWAMFQLVLTTWLGQVDIPVRSSLKNWELQYCCLSVLRELILVLEAAQASGHPHDSVAADKLQRRLLHDDLKESGLLPVLCRCARSFKPHVMARGHAVDVIMALACVVRTLDRLASAEEGFLVKRKKTGGGRPRPKPAVEEEDEQADTQQQKDTDGKADGDADNEKAKDEASGAGDKDANNGDDDQNNKAGDNEDGGEKVDKEGEGETAADGDKAGNVETDKKPASNRRDPMEMLEDEEEWEYDDEARNRRVAEVQYDLDRRLRQELAQPAVVHFLVIQGMAFYSHNSAPVNKAVAALLWRVANPEGLNLQPMMYQLSVLRVMHKVLSDRAIRVKQLLPDFQDLLVLATKVTRGLFSKLCPAEATEQEMRKELFGDDYPDNTDSNTKQNASKAGGPSSSGNGRVIRSGGADGGEGSDNDDGLEIEGGDDNDKGKSGGGDDNNEDEEEDPDRKALRLAHEAAERDKRVKDAVERENKIRMGISGMLCADVMFWKTASVAEEISADYFLRLKADLDHHDTQYRPTAKGRQRPDRDAGGDGDGGNKVANWEEDDQQEVEPLPAAAAPPKGPRDLAAEHEKLRKLHLSKKAAKAKAAGGAGLALPPEQQKQLITEFERLNAHKSNLDLLLDKLIHNDDEDQDDDYDDNRSKSKASQWSKDRILKALKALGYKFGRPTDSQLDQLRSLWKRHGRDEDMTDALLLCAADMTGGWTSKQVRAMLYKYGIVEKSGRKGRKGSDDDDGSSGTETEGDYDVDPVLQEQADALDEERVLDLFMKNKDKAEEEQIAAIAETLDVTPGPVRLKLIDMAMIERPAVERTTRRGTQDPRNNNNDKPKRGSNKHRNKGKSSSRKTKSKTMVPIDELRELYEKHKDLPDTLNRIASELSVQLTAKQVGKMLAKCNIVRDEAAARKAAKLATERAQLIALYQRHRLEDDYLQRMADNLPGVVNSKQVLKLMRKHGLLEGGGSSRRRHADMQPHEVLAWSDDDGGPDGGDDGGVVRAAAGRVPEPHADKVMQCLAAIKAVRGNRWMSPQEAVAWLVSKIDAAEQLWARAAQREGASGYAMDYSLIMETDDDEKFFMTDYAQELLEAAGIRNDAADYYKIPGNSDAAWRRRVKATLASALERLEDEAQFEAALQAFQEEQQRKKSGVAAAAPTTTTAAALPASRHTAPLKQTLAGNAAAVDSDDEDLVIEDADGPSSGQAGQSTVPAGGDGGEGLADRRTANFTPYRTGQMMALESDTDNDSDDGLASDTDSDNNSDSGSDSDSGRRKGSRGKKDTKSRRSKTAKGSKKPKSKKASIMPDLGGSSDDEEAEGKVHDEDDEDGEAVKHAAKKSRKAAATTRRPAPAALLTSPQSKGQHIDDKDNDHDQENTQRAGGNDSDDGNAAFFSPPARASKRAQPGTDTKATKSTQGKEKRAPTVTVEARRAALAALAAKRRQLDLGAGDQDGAGPADGKTQQQQQQQQQHQQQHQKRQSNDGGGNAAGRQPLRDADNNAAGDNRQPDVGGGKRRRLLKAGGAENDQEKQAAPAAPAAVQDSLEDELEDF